MQLDMMNTHTDRLLVEAFGPRVFIIGGSVRDKLREQFHQSPYTPKDRDYVIVGIPIEQVRERLGFLGRVVEVGASFPILKLTVGGEVTVDVALPHRDRSLASQVGRQRSTEFADISMVEDQSTRDFRMNAISVQLMTGEVMELPGAIDDIRQRRICAINGRQTFLDDPLRVMRAAQFASRFGFSIEEETWKAIRDCAPLLRNRAAVPAERISEELSKLLVKSNKPSIGIRLLQDAGILGLVIPGLDTGAGVEQNDYHAYDVLGHNLATLDASRNTLESRWAALLHDIGKPASRSAEKVHYGYTFYNHEVIGAEMAQQVLRDLHYGTELVDRVTRLVANHMYNADPSISDSAIRRFINRIDPSLLDDQFHLRHCDKIGCGLPVERTLERNHAFQSRVYEILHRKEPRTVRDLALRGHDVFASMIALGYSSADAKPGAMVGNILRQLRELVIDQPELNTPAGLTEKMTTIIARLKRERDDMP
jgi:tRNA nucleotidyltransferase (CCA-adding enzyme)